MPTISRTDIVAGDTSDVWEIGLVTSASGVKPVVLAALDVNFTCWIGVAAAVPPIQRQVTVKNAANTRFRAWLTPAETAALGLGVWLVGIELRNPTLIPPLIAEVQRRVGINPGAVTA